MEPLNVGLVGAGGRGCAHADSLKDHSRIRFQAVCDIDNELAQKAAREYDVEAFTDLDAMLKRDDIEAVVVVTQAQDHAPVTIQALEAGKHVLCEKPMADDTAAARRMLEMAESQNLKGTISYQQRFSPAMWTLKNAVESLDPIQVLVGGQRGIFLEKYLRPGFSYGIMDTTCHQIDLVNWLIGAKPTSVVATLRQGTFTDTGAIDAISLHIEYETKDGDSAVGTIFASMAGSGLSNPYQVVGKKGNAEVQDDEIHVTDVEFDPSKKGKEKQITSSRTIPCDADYPDNNNKGLHAAFADYVQGVKDIEEAKIATFKDGLYGLAVLEAAEKSWRENRKIDLSELIQ